MMKKEVCQAPDHWSKYTTKERAEKKKEKSSSEIEREKKEKEKLICLLQPL